MDDCYGKYWIPTAESLCAFPHINISGGPIS